MAAQKGRSFLLKEGTAAAGTNMAAMRRRRLPSTTSRWTPRTRIRKAGGTLLEAAGTQSMDISAEGVFTDETIEETVRGYAFANSINEFAIVFGNGDSIDGDWAITNYQRSGAFNGEETYSLTLQSSGAPTFTAAA